MTYVPSRNATTVFVTMSTVKLAMWPTFDKWSMARGTSIAPNVVTGVDSSTELSVKFVMSWPVRTVAGPALLGVATGLCRLRKDDLRPGIVMLRRVVVARGVLFLDVTCVVRALGCLPDVLGTCGRRRIDSWCTVVPVLGARAPLQLG